MRGSQGARRGRGGPREGLSGGGAVARPASRNAKSAPRCPRWEPIQEHLLTAAEQLDEVWSDPRRKARPDGQTLLKFREALDHVYDAALRILNRAAMAPAGGLVAPFQSQGVRSTLDPTVPGGDGLPAAAQAGM